MLMFEHLLSSLALEFRIIERDQNLQVSVYHIRQKIYFLALYHGELCPLSEEIPSLLIFSTSLTFCLRELGSRDIHEEALEDQ